MITTVTTSLRTKPGLMIQYSIGVLLTNSVRTTEYGEFLQGSCQDWGCNCIFRADFKVELVDVRTPNSSGLELEASTWQHHDNKSRHAASLVSHQYAWQSNACEKDWRSVDITANLLHIPRHIKDSQRYYSLPWIYHLTTCKTQRRAFPLLFGDQIRSAWYMGHHTQ